MSNKEREEFEKWFYSQERPDFWETWIAARKDHYRIGEEVEVKSGDGFEYTKAKIGARTFPGVGGYIQYEPENVRPVPEWEPKEGEAVFAIDATGKVWAAKVRSIDCDGIYVICSDGDVSMWNRERMKPFSADKIGKPWGEI